MRLTSTPYLWNFFLGTVLLVGLDTRPIYAAEQKVSSSQSPEWQQTVGALLKSNLWSARDIYDASHVLMVPLHYAFITQDQIAISQFETMFTRFANAELPGGQLNQVHWMYLVSRYLSLKTEFKVPFSDADQSLLQRSIAHLRYRWELAPDFQWGSFPFFGLKARLEYVLDEPSSIDLLRERSYYRAVTDYELFVLAIGNDLGFVYNNRPDIAESDRKLAVEVFHYTYRILEKRVTSTKSNGMLFQVGYWRDHPDYQFAGHLTLGKDLGPSKKADVAEDSGHSHRWPLWLESFRFGAVTVAQFDAIEVLQQRLSHQLKNSVFYVTENGVLLRNYLDGSNGIYRYGYGTTGSNELNGYGPYMLSGSLGEGWYCFAPNMSQEYRYYRDSYPLNQALLDLYVGPNTNRKRNPLLVWPDFFTNGFAEVVAEQCSFVAETYPQRKEKVEIWKRFVSRR
ncbi:MAG: hypothetical protein KDI36_20005 [Pseudomonadales bacterium]|nr:hypothetical protein [Pseudomonadales bacterium]